MKKLFVMFLSCVLLSLTSCDSFNSRNYFSIVNNSSKSVSFYYEYESDLLYTLQSKESVEIEAKAPISSYYIKSKDLPYSVDLKSVYYQISFEDKTAISYNVYNSNFLVSVTLTYIDTDGVQQSVSIPKADNSTENVYNNYKFTTYDSWSVTYTDTNGNKRDATNFIFVY